MRPTIHAIQPVLCDRIIEEARHILATTGMEICGSTLRTKLLERGLVPSADDMRLLFPPEVVDQALKSAPATFTLFDRLGRPHTEIGTQTCFTPGSSGLRILDHRTGRVRPTQTADFVEYIRHGSADTTRDTGTLWRRAGRVSHARGDRAHAGR